MSLEVRPISFRDACRFIAKHHRYLKPPQGCKFCIAVAEDGEIVGVVVAGLPVARMMNDGFTIEITRMATDGTRNAISALAGAVRRTARAMGYRKVITYAMDCENRGESLRSAGFIYDGRTKAGLWSRSGRERDDKHPTEAKSRWFALEAPE